VSKHISGVLDLQEFHRRFQTEPSKPPMHVPRMHLFSVPQLPPKPGIQSSPLQCSVVPQSPPTPGIQLSPDSVCFNPVQIESFIIISDNSSHVLQSDIAGRSFL